MSNKEITFLEYAADAVVVGAGHAGCEAALALARTGIKTALLTLNLDSIAFLPCNPKVVQRRYCGLYKLLRQCFQVRL